MTEVQQVIDQQAVIRFQVEPFTHTGPCRIRYPMEVGNVGRVGKCGVAHPYPEPVILFDQGKGPHAGVFRNSGLPGDRNAFARSIEGETVIAALQVPVD